MPTKSEISSQTLHHLLRLSALPQPSSPAEEEKLLSALHDQLHFVRHVQSVPTDGVHPLSRIGYEPRPDDDIGVLTFEECVEATQTAGEKAAGWKQWSVMDLPGGSRLGREEGYFVVVSKSTEPDVQDKEKASS
jgi:Asp-tRNA(Asn)/Glu-tRNA(Gln) amidotransferase C subunit